jgi:hypothetical protein
MNATKRKFNALIQGIGSRSQASDTPNETSTSNVNRLATITSGTMALDSDLLAKRRRLGITTSGVGTTTTNSTNTAGTPISNALLKRWGQHETKPASNVDAAPKYSPSDRGELLKRLATFQEITDWTPKPDRVSEVEWAKRGWMCQGKERVRCTLCHKELVVKLNRREVGGKEVSVLVPSEIGTWFRLET